MNKKAQAAMEFLMTYGWAILVVLAAIGALAYFGVLSPDKFLSEKCTLPSSSGLGCIDWTANDRSNISLVIKNGAGFDMTDLSINFTGKDVCPNSHTAIDLSNGEQKTVNIVCSSGEFSSSNSFKSDMEISYTNKATELSHVKKGEVIISLPN
jgi:hypothetical protein